VAVVQYTFTHKQYTEQHNETEYIEKKSHDNKNTYLLTYLLHRAVSSWEASWFAASQEIPRISRNPKVHYRTHKRPPTVSILGQPNPVHIPTSQLLEIHPSIMHPSTPRSPQWFLPSDFPAKTLYTPSPRPYNKNT